MSLHHRRPIAALAACALLIASAASAQERPEEFDDRILSGWSFTPSFRLTGMWDSNVALAGRSVEGTTEGDRVLVFVPSGQFDFVAPRTGFSAGYRGFVRRYLDVEQLNGYDQRAYFTLRHSVTPRLDLFAQNEFAEMPTTDVVELNGLPFARIGSRSNRLAAGVETRLTKLTDLSVRYENMWVGFDRDDELLGGGTIHGIQARVRRQLSARAAFGAEGRMRRSDVSPDLARVIWFNDVGATFDYRLTEFVTLDVAAGFSQLRDSRFADTRNAPYYRARLRRSIERATVGISLERSYAPSFGFGGSNDNREIRGFVRMPFSRNRYYVNGDATWRRSDPFTASEIRLDTFLTNVTVGYAATRWLRMEGYHAFSRQDSIITGGEVDRHRVGAQVVVSQPMRIR